MAGVQSAVQALRSCDALFFHLPKRFVQVPNRLDARRQGHRDSILTRYQNAQHYSCQNVGAGLHRMCFQQARGQDVLRRFHRFLGKNMEAIRAGPRTHHRKYRYGAQPADASLPTPVPSWINCSPPRQVQTCPMSRTGNAGCSRGKERTPLQKLRRSRSHPDFPTPAGRRSWNSKLLSGNSSTSLRSLGLSDNVWAPTVNDSHGNQFQL